MIRITSIKRCHVADYDEIYLIVRSIATLEKSKSSILLHAKQLEALSPSKELFYKQLNCTRSEEWTEEKFNNEYKPEFIYELNENPEANEWLDEIAAKDAEGKKIALLCFCANENLCHRSIIGELLKNRGCAVIMDKDTKRGNK